MLWHLMQAKVLLCVEQSCYQPAKENFSRKTYSVMKNNIKWITIVAPVVIRFLADLIHTCSKPAMAAEAAVTALKKCVQNSVRFKPY